MPLTWTIAIPENILSYSLYASPGFSLLHNKSYDLFQIGSLTIFGHSSDSVLNEINVAVSQRY
jgi:hypothetical protein